MLSWYAVSLIAHFSLASAGMEPVSVPWDWLTCSVPPSCTSVVQTDSWVFPKLVPSLGSAGYRDSLLYLSKVDSVAPMGCLSRLNFIRSLTQSLQDFFWGGFHLFSIFGVNGLILTLFPLSRGGRSRVDLL